MNATLVYGFVPAKLPLPSARGKKGYVFPPAADNRFWQATDSIELGPSGHATRVVNQKDSTGAVLFANARATALCVLRSTLSLHTTHFVGLA